MKPPEDDDNELCRHFVERNSPHKYMYICRYVATDGGCEGSSCRAFLRKALPVLVLVSFTAQAVLVSV